MMYAVTFSVLAMCLFALAVLQGGLGYVMLWPTVSFLVVAAGYATLGAGVFGKRPDGTISWWAVVLFLPYLLLLWGLWHLLRMTQREAFGNEIAPRLWLGRRPLAHEVPDDIDLIVDLTAEFFEPGTVTGKRTYVCLPVLDGSVPDPFSFESIVERTSAWPGHVYIHCASGHGRSALLMAAVLIRKGIAGNVEQAIERIKTARPGIGLGKQQLNLLETWMRKTQTGDVHA